MNSNPLGLTEGSTELMEAWELVYVRGRPPPPRAWAQDAQPNWLLYCVAPTSAPPHPPNAFAEAALRWARSRELAASLPMAAVDHALAAATAFQSIGRAELAEIVTSEAAVLLADRGESRAALALCPETPGSWSRDRWAVVFGILGHQSRVERLGPVSVPKDPLWRPRAHSTSSELGQTSAAHLAAGDTESAMQAAVLALQNAETRSERRRSERWLAEVELASGNLTGARRRLVLLRNELPTGDLYYDARIWLLYAASHLDTSEAALQAFDRCEAGAERWSRDRIAVGLAADRKAWKRAGVSLPVLAALQDKHQLPAPAGLVRDGTLPALRLDVGALSASYGDHTLDFAQKYRLFRLLLEVAVSQRLPKPELFERVWGVPYRGRASDNPFHVAVSRLRELLKPTGLTLISEDGLRLGGDHQIWVESEAEPSGSMDDKWQEWLTHERTFSVEREVALSAWMVEHWPKRDPGDPRPAILAAHLVKCPVPVHEALSDLQSSTSGIGLRARGLLADQGIDIQQARAAAEALLSSEEDEDRLLGTALWARASLRRPLFLQVLHAGNAAARLGNVRLATFIWLSALATLGDEADDTAQRREVVDKVRHSAHQHGLVHRLAEAEARESGHCRWTGRWWAAVNHAQRAVEHIRPLGPIPAYYAFILARAHLVHGDFLGVRHALELPTLSNSPRDRLFREFILANLALETGALDEAERQFRTLIGVAIDGAQAFLETLMAGLGSVLLVRKQGSALQQLISRNPTTKTEFWQLLLATNHHARGEWTDALHQYQALWPQKLSFLQRERLHLRWTCLALTSGLPGPPDLGARQPSALLRSARERVIGTPTTAEVAESFEGRLVELLLTAK